MDVHPDDAEQDTVLPDETLDNRGRLVGSDVIHRVEAGERRMEEKCGEYKAERTASQMAHCLEQKQSLGGS